MSNWVGYIDPDRKLVADFEQANGIAVDYVEDLTDNEALYEKAAPLLKAGKSLDRDLMVPSAWLGGRLASKGWLSKVPAELAGNDVRTALASMLVRSFDRSDRYLVPWALGITGIAYNRKTVGGAITAINDLFDARLKGRVALLNDMRDTVGLTLLSVGKDPVKTDVDGAAPAFERLEKARRDGQVRSFANADYLEDLASGDLAACVARSSEALQIMREQPDVDFVVPTEGAMLWGDVMVIPATAANPDAATAWMEYFYEPKNAARLTAAIQYTSPVVGCRDALTALGGDAAALADSPVLFPDDDVLARLHTYRNYPTDDETAFKEAFAQIVEI